MPGVNDETWSATIRGEQRISISIKYRTCGDDLIIFTHGLGCSKESFDGAFSAPELLPYSLCSFDFPSHGGSGEMDRGADIASLADVTRYLIDRLGPKRLFMVCHSMGGAVGLVAAQDLSNLAAFISVEGNLVSEDCGLVSRGIAHQSVEEFTHTGFPAHVGSLAASREPSLARWAHWYARSRPQGVHSIARSLVEWCDSDKLIEIFLKIRTKAYVQGERSDVAHLVGRLRNTPIQMVAASGHFPMLDNPAEFYALVAALVAEPSMPGTSPVSGRPSL